MSFAWPVHLAGDIHVRSAGWGDPAVWAGLSLLAGWAVLFAWSFRRRPALAFGLGWTALTLLPASGLLLPTAIPVAVRFLYLPSLGLALALMLLVRPVLEARLRPEWPRVAVILPFVLLLGALTARRNLEYRDDAAFYTSLIRSADRSGFGVEPGISSLVNYATLVGKQGRLDEAETLTRRAIGEEPRSAMAWNNLGIVRALRRDLAGSLAAFREALRLDPGDAKTRFNVALTLDQMGRGAEALAAYRTASSLPLDEETRRQTLERLRALAADTSATLRAPAAAR
jgi:tetratricopeptide (TPR) repeat protein